MSKPTTSHERVQKVYPTPQQAHLISGLALHLGKSKSEIYQEAFEMYKNTLPVEDLEQARFKAKQKDIF